MCTGKCAKCIGCALIPLSILCITCNAILFFPGWSTEPSKDAALKLTPEVHMYLGIIAGGILMCISILVTAAALCGSLFCLVMSAVALHRGPVCQYSAPQEANTTDSPVSPVPTTNTSLIWGRPFENPLIEYNNENYIFHREMWDTCVEPPDVVEFHVILFSILVAASSIETILCFIQMLNGLFGLICGTCRDKDDDREDMVKDDAKKEYKY